MLSILKDLSAHLSPLSTLETIRVEQTTDNIEIIGMEQNQHFFLRATAKINAISVGGIFGMSNFGRLHYLLSNREYKTNSKIDIKIEARGKEGLKVPTLIEFNNEDGDFTNVYRFISSAIPSVKKLTELSYTIPKCNNEFEPSLKSIERFKSMTGAFTSEQFFKFKLENENLIIAFGEDNTDSGEFVFHSGIKNKVDTVNYWPAESFNTIFSLDGKKTLKMSTEGALLITIDSGLIVYEFMILALSK